MLPGVSRFAGMSEKREMRALQSMCLRYCTTSCQRKRTNAGSFKNRRLPADLERRSIALCADALAANDRMSPGLFLSPTSCACATYVPTPERFRFQVLRRQRCGRTAQNVLGRWLAQFSVPRIRDPRQIAGQSVQSGSGRVRSASINAHPRSSSLCASSFSSSADSPASARWTTLPCLLLFSRLFAGSESATEARQCAKSSSQASSCSTRRACAVTARWLPQPAKQQISG